MQRDSHLGKVAVLGAGLGHFGGAAVAPHFAGARQLILFVGHAAVMGTAYICGSAARPGSRLRSWTALPFERCRSSRFARTVCAVVDLKPVEATTKGFSSAVSDANTPPQKNENTRRQDVTAMVIMLMGRCRDDPRVCEE